MTETSPYPVGFIGLGSMGESMALNLAGAGTPLLIWNRTPARADPLRAAGGRYIEAPVSGSRGPAEAVAFASRSLRHRKYR